MYNRIKLVFLIGLTGLPSLILVGQSKYWVHTRDTSALNTHYQITIDWCSEWLSYCTFTAQDLPISTEDLVPSVSPVMTFERLIYPDDKKLGFGLEQIEGHLLMSEGLTGKGVKIGIIDGGFLEANEHPTLIKHFEDDRVKFYKDYITPDKPPYSGFKNLDDEHGTDVWTLIGGIHATTGVTTGIATDAEYYLARTDHGGFEKRIEEDLAIKALEEFHKKGIQLVNMSLGYSDGYTRRSENYRPEQMDGKTSMIAKAIDIAYNEKNMLIVVSAGNEGNRPDWRVLSTPADAEGALSVGATILSGLDIMPYSSIGTPDLGYIKPEVVCFATAGTSFSAPLITGLAAAIWQSDPDLSAKDIKDIIIQSSSLFPYGNNNMGYGVPKGSRILKILQNEIPSEAIHLVRARNKFIVNPNDSENRITILHKNKHNEVIGKNSQIINDKKIKIRPIDQCMRTTLILKDRSLEILWEK
jgi:subtilisin family serine protease